MNHCLLSVISANLQYISYFIQPQRGRSVLLLLKNDSLFSTITWTCEHHMYTENICSFDFDTLSWTLAGAVLSFVQLNSLYKRCLVERLLDTIWPDVLAVKWVFFFLEYQFMYSTCAFVNQQLTYSSNAKRSYTDHIKCCKLLPKQKQTIQWYR